MFIGNSQKEARYLSFLRFLSLSGLSLSRFKITADILITFAGEFFTEEIENTDSGELRNDSNYILDGVVEFKIYLNNRL